MHGWLRYPSALATVKLGLAWLGIMDLVLGEYGTYLGYGSCSLDGRVLLVSRYGGAGGYLRFANCLLIGAGIEFDTHAIGLVSYLWPRASPVRHGCGYGSVPHGGCCRVMRG